MRTSSIALAVGGALLVSSSAALAQSPEYPPPARPGGGAEQKCPARSTQQLQVTKRAAEQGDNTVSTIQQAVNRARPGATILVADGVYREGVRIVGARKRCLKLVGNTRNPARVVLEGKGLRKDQAGAFNNGVFINGADNVEVRGFTARNYPGNGFFARSVIDYRFEKLVAMKTGVYGTYAFDSIGGVMRDSVGAWTNDAGFYIGQTPPQRRPRRSIVERVSSYGNVIGFSGTNMRYVTIRNSKWFNNGLGIVPNALTSEKYWPEEDNVISNNEIFWNNFNYFAGAPFALRQSSTAIPYPVGTGVLFFGGRNNAVLNNQIFGNWLVGAAAATQFEMLDPDAEKFTPAQVADIKAKAVLRGTRIQGNTFNKGGQDKNGRDIFLDGSGSGNCESNNTGATVFEPADRKHFLSCPSTAPNGGPDNNVFNTAAVGWATDPTHESFWVRNPHSRMTYDNTAQPALRGKAIQPLRRYSEYRGPDRPSGSDGRCIVSTQPASRGARVPPPRPC